jgi:predicted exporter
MVWRTPFTADLSAFLPANPDKEQQLLIDQLRQGVAGRSLMVAISGGAPGEDAAQNALARSQASRDLAKALRADPNFTSVSNGEREGYESAGEVLLAHRYVLSPQVSAERFTPQGLHAAMQDTALRVATPEGAAFKPLWPRDPTGEVMQVAESLLPVQSPRMQHGVWVFKDGSQAVMVLTLAAASDDIDGQAKAIDAVTTAFAAVVASSPSAKGLQVHVSGHGAFSVQSRALIKDEADRLAFGGAVALVAVLWLAFGQVKAVLLAALPVLSGVLAGMLAVGLTHGQVHGMTVGFGAALVGEAVDYGIYYLIQARPTAAAHGSWWKDGWPTVRLGLLTSLIGFAALVFSGFPGLVQLGVFSMAGLAGAAAVTRYVLPQLAPLGASGMGLRVWLGRVGARLAHAATSLRWVAYAGTAVALVSVWLSPLSPWRGDLQALSPVPQSLIDQDMVIRQALGASDARTLVVAQGATMDEALEAAEAASQALDTLVVDGHLLGYESPSRLLPSRAAQRTRLAALPSDETLQANVQGAIRLGLPFEATQVAAFVDDVRTARERKAPITAQTYAGTPLAAVVDAMVFERVTPAGAARSSTTAADSRYVAVLPLHLPEPPTVTQSTAASATAALSSEQRLKLALAAIPSATVLDVKQLLDGLYARYLREALWQSLAGGAAVLALLALNLRNARRWVRVVLPLAMSVVIVVAVLHAAGVPMGILHLIGLLLTVAVGSNYALFFDHAAQLGPLGDQPDTLASLLLANITTVITFGWMATSAITALSSIGQTVALGALLSLVLSAVLARPQGHP